MTQMEGEGGEEVTTRDFKAPKKKAPSEAFKFIIICWKDIITCFNNCAHSKLECGATSRMNKAEKEAEAERDLSVVKSFSLRSVLECFFIWKSVDKKCLI
jgi:hypothetical protein